MVKDILTRVVDRGITLGAEFVDVRLQKTIETQIEVTDKQIKNVQVTELGGVGTRAFLNGTWGFTTNTQLTTRPLELTAVKAAKISKAIGKRKGRSKFSLIAPDPIKATITIPSKVKLTDISLEQKASLVKNISQHAMSVDKNISSTSVTYRDVTGTSIVHSSAGTHVETTISKVLMEISVTAKGWGKHRQSTRLEGALGGYEIVDNENIYRNVENLTLQTVRLLKAQSPPSGSFTVVLDPELAGILAHEVFGHALEADLILAGNSIISRDLSAVTGSSEITIVDDATIPGMLGSFFYDDEGNPSQENTLVEQGVLKNALHNIDTASRMSSSLTANARVEDYRCPPLVRTSNTYFATGAWSLKEMLEGIDFGIYAKGPGYGIADPAKGEFTLKCGEAHIIQRGETKASCHDVILTGTVFNVLENIDAVGRELQLRPGICTKFRQDVPISSGGPHLRIRKLQISGT